MYLNVKRIHYSVKSLELNFKIQGTFIAVTGWSMVQWAYIQSPETTIMVIDCHRDFRLPLYLSMMGQLASDAE
ncbi:hypothetical protein ABBQ32_003746 [Trebouxia sp. C0010 RCD-2024]